VIVADDGSGLHALINPKIVSKSGKQTFVEGCLSLPGVEAPVERAAKLKVSALNRCGQRVEIEAEAMLATILQHEIDHLDGLVFIDRVKDPSLIRYLPLEKEKQQELI
jgi:peptide deformylase